MMHLNRGTDAPPNNYGKHDAWNTPCNGFWQESFDFDADPLEYTGRHRSLQTSELVWR